MRCGHWRAWGLSTIASSLRTPEEWSLKTRSSSPRVLLRAAFNAAMPSPGSELDWLLSSRIPCPLGIVGSVPTGVNRRDLSGDVRLVVMLDGNAESSRKLSTEPLLLGVPPARVA